jgi:hypothetical protein
MIQAVRQMARTGFWSKFRRVLLCRIGVHYDADYGTIRDGVTYMCCYDCGALRHSRNDTRVVRTMVIERQDGSLTTVVNRRSHG